VVRTGTRWSCREVGSRSYGGGGARSQRDLERKECRLQKQESRGGQTRNRWMKKVGLFTKREIETEERGIGTKDA